jgi:hypothetical protein
MSAKPQASMNQSLTTRFVQSMPSHVNAAKTHVAATP